MRIAVLDQGTTSTRAVVCADDAPPRLALARRHQQSFPKPGWVEQDPAELLANLFACLAAAGPVDAVALTNQGESCLGWDRTTGEPLSPLLVWQDTRCEPAMRRLRERGHEAKARAISGLGLDAYFSAGKLAWLLDECPAVVAALRAGRLALGTSDAFFLRHLTGRAATDVTTAARTGLMDLLSGTWSEELCALHGIPPDCLPPIAAPVDDFGRIGGLPLAVSVVDQVAALYGHGCRRPGELKITFGTGAFALALLERPTPGGGDGALLEVAAWPTAGRPGFALDGGVFNAGSAVEWLLRIGVLGGVTDLQALGGEPAIDRDLAFVPALSGLGSPHFDRRAAGLWLGLGLDTSREDLVRAVLEGIALRTGEVVAAIGRRQPLAGSISVDGGLSRCSYFLRVLASVLGRPVCARGLPELTAYGAALLLAEREGVRLQPAAEPDRLIDPAWDGAPWIERFAEARRRAGGWRPLP